MKKIKVYFTQFIPGNVDIEKIKKLKTYDQSWETMLVTYSTDNKKNIHLLTDLQEAKWLCEGMTTKIPGRKIRFAQRARIIEIDGKIIGEYK